MPKETVIDESVFEAKQRLYQLACKKLDLKTLETRNSDSLDFHDLAVWQIKNVLDLAFNIGMAAAIDGGRKA